MIYNGLEVRKIYLAIGSSFMTIEQLVKVYFCLQFLYNSLKPQKLMGRNEVRVFSQCT